MYFDFEDYRPEIPRVTRAVSVREGVLLSIIVHLALVIVVLLFPDLLTRSTDALVQVEPVADREPLRFVEAVPLRDLPAPPIRPADQSDLDRRSSTIEQAPRPENAAPFMRGNSPEMVEGGPRTPPAGGPPPSPASASPEAAPFALDDPRATAADLARQPPRPASPAAADLGRSLRNLNQYLRDDQFDNDRGGQTDRGADIQFDSKGIDFGPWLRRFKAQVERNWLVPQAAMMYKTRVVLQFNVLRNGTITDLVVLEPAAIPALTSSSLNALKLSNPTAALPTDYPADKVLFTVTFWYNLNPRDFR